MKHGEGNTELSLLKFLPLAYHQAISWLPPWISHLFLQWPSWGPYTFFTVGLDVIIPLSTVTNIHSHTCIYNSLQTSALNELIKNEVLFQQ